MAEISRENFYARLDTAPHAVRGFFETIIQHVERKNDVLVHFGDTRWVPRFKQSQDGNLRAEWPTEPVAYCATATAAK
jgi:hypothetical protein